MRQGIRAGSRWPFTRPAQYLPDQFRFGTYMPYPWFMGSAAAYVERAVDGCHAVFMRDSIARGESYASFFTYLRDVRPDAIICETGQASLNNDLDVLRTIKLHMPHVRVALAGPVAKTAYDEGKGLGTVDAYLVGEYEKPSVDFIEGRNGLISFNALSRDELGHVPYPLFDEGCAYNYHDACPIGVKAPELQLWASRGCFAVCNFCSFPATMTNDDPLGLGGRKIRFYDPEWIEGFIRHRMEVAKTAGHPLASVRFDGDTENASNKHTLAICEVMKRIGLPWSMMCRADTSSPEVWKAMKDAGCFGVKIGFESGSDRIVNEVVKKRLDLKKAAETARYLRSIGLEVHGTFMIGHPTETAEERQMTIDFIRELYATNGITSHQLSGAAEIGGTPLANSTITDPNYVKNADGVAKLEGLAR